VPAVCAVAAAAHARTIPTHTTAPHTRAIRQLLGDRTAGALVEGVTMARDAA
jgi:hypothetical protein